MYKHGVVNPGSTCCTSDSKNVTLTPFNCQALPTSGRSLTELGGSQVDRPGSNEQVEEKKPGDFPSSRSGDRRRCCSE
jgi:hypothetical protein